ncbi:hypothetical protein Tco_1141382 [Tanacetum coccineum]
MHLTGSRNSNYVPITSRPGTLQNNYRIPCLQAGELRVSLIHNFVSKDYKHFVMNYNIHCMGKTIIELHAMLKLTEKGLPKKAHVLIVLAVQERKIQKKRNKPKAANGKGKGKAKLTYAPKNNIPSPTC